MSIVAARVDDRLVHGQVVIGWGRPLQIGRIVLVDSEVAASPFEQDLYRMAVPAGIEIEFLSGHGAGHRVSELADSTERVLVLTGTVAGMIGLARETPATIRSINLGGIHDGPARREYLRYVYLTDAELTELRALAATGVHITAQDVPTASPVALEVLAA